MTILINPYIIDPTPTVRPANHRFAEFYELPNMDKITVTEPLPTSNLFPFVVSVFVSLIIITAVFRFVH
jgi:hypothetical protein